VLPSDPTAQVAAIGIVTTLITTTGVLLVAVLNNHKERVDAADTGVELALREQITVRDERIALRDDQIKDLQDDLVTLRGRLADEVEGNDVKGAVIANLRAEVASKAATIAELREELAGLRSGK